MTGLPPLLRARLRLAGVSLLSGVLLGLGARGVMRAIAIESGLPVAFSLMGSVDVVAFGTMIGAPVAFVFLILRGRLSVRRPWAGMGCGLLLFLILALFPPPSARSAMTGTPDAPAATAFAFALLFALWGIFVDSLSRRYGDVP